MALQKQNVNIPLAVGIDQKKDQKQLAVGKLNTLENGVFTKIGEVRHRFGYTAKNRSVTDGTNITDGRKIFTYKDELNLITKDNLYSYVNSNNWISKGTFYTAGVTTKQVVRNNYRQLSPSVAYTKGIGVYAWEDSSGGVRCSVIDRENNEAVLSNSLVDVNASNPFCIAGADYLYIYYYLVGDTSLNVRRIDPLNPTTLETATKLATDLDTDVFYDITPFGTNSFVLVYKNATPKISISYLKIDGDIAGVLDGYPSTVTFNDDVESSICVKTLNVGDLTNDGIYIFYHQTTDGLLYIKYPTNLTGTPTPVVVDSETTTVRNITANFLTNSSLQVWYEIEGASSWKNYIKSNTVSSGVAGTESVWLRGVGLASKAWRYDSGDYVIVTHSSTLQSTYFTVKSLSVSQNTIINKISPSRGAGLTTNQSLLPAVYNTGNDTFLAVTNNSGRLTTETGTLAGVEGVQGVSIDFNASDLYASERISGSLLIAGGLLQHYDGVNIVEHGFSLYPENITATVANGGYLEQGTRGAKFIYEWTDAQGQLHRSAPSVALQYITNATDKKCTFVIPTLKLTEKKSVKGEVNIVGYSTVVDGTTYYRMTPVTTPVINDVTVDTVTFVWGDSSGETDASIIDNEILYTTGGVLENIAPPSAKILKAYNNRMFIAGLPDSNEMWYSKITAQDEGIAFTDSFTNRVDKGNGGVTGYGVLDDKLVIFKNNQIFAMIGQGATDTGAEDDYQTPQQITADVGCSESRSIIETPLGIFYKSTKGIYLLDRSLVNTYKGAQVEDYNDYEVLGAELLENVNQVRFILENGICLVYDYYFDEWSVFTNFTNVVSSCIWQGQYVWLSSDGFVNVENWNTFKDNSVFVPMKIITSWVQIAGLQGYQRVYSGLLLGEFKSSHTLRLRVGYNFNDWWVDDLTVDPKAVLGLSAYGEDGYGEGSFGGGLLSDAIYQWQFKQSIQKCQSIRFEITGLDTYGLDGAGYAISSLVLECGVKKGYNKISADKSFGGA